jgi:hypothetical protein
MLTRARAGLGSDMAEDDGWEDVSVRASLLPEDMQGVFMMIARAAKEGWPCPGDAAIARAYGSHSLRRARRLLTYIEEQGLIVCQFDGAGRRIVTLVELAWATAPGNPNAMICQRNKAAALRLHDASSLTRHFAPQAPTAHFIYVVIAAFRDRIVTIRFVTVLLQPDDNSIYVRSG